MTTVIQKLSKNHFFGFKRPPHFQRKLKIDLYTITIILSLYVGLLCKKVTITKLVVIIAFYKPLLISTSLMTHGRVKLT